MTRSGRLVAALLGLAVTTAPAAGTDAATEPGVTHVVYLHGAIVEGDDPRPEHPTFGVYDYPAIVEAFERAGFEVVSEQRRARTVAERYADTVARTVRGLVDDGIRPEQIAVVGHSKGGAISLLASSRLREPRVRWVILAGCFPAFPVDLRITGHVLSALDRSDRMAVSCRPWATETTSYEELTLETGRGHGLFYDPDESWLDPVVAWLRAAEGSN